MGLECVSPPPDAARAQRIGPRKASVLYTFHLEPGPIRAAPSPGAGEITKAYGPPIQRSELHQEHRGQPVFRSHHFPVQSSRRQRRNLVGAHLIESAVVRPKNTPAVDGNFVAALPFAGPEVKREIKFEVNGVPPSPRPLQHEITRGRHFADDLTVYSDPRGL